MTTLKPFAIHQVANASSPVEVTLFATQTSSTTTRTPRKPTNFQIHLDRSTFFLFPFTYHNGQYRFVTPEIGYCAPLKNDYAGKTPGDMQFLSRSAFLFCQVLQ